MAAPHLFCFGLGYSAQVIARRLLGEGWVVSATCRDQEKAEALQRDGISAQVMDSGQPITDLATALNGVTHLMSSVPPTASGDPVLGMHRAELEAVGHTLQWIGYLSTVGVYGDHQGRWIDESCPPNPQSESSRRRLQAENEWLALGSGLQVPSCLFRLPGIYGPGARNQISALKAGRARRIIKQDQVFNRIHVEDLASAMIASMEKSNESRIYNVTDDEPAPSDHVVTFASELLGIEPPPEEIFEKAELSAFARHFYAECKRVKNDRMQQELGVRLRYPNYRQGLRAILQDMQ